MWTLRELRNHTISGPCENRRNSRIILAMNEDEVCIRVYPLGSLREEVELTRAEAVRMANIIRKTFPLDAIGPA